MKLSPENLVVLADLIENNSDATLDELCQMLKEKLGVSISRATMGRMTQRLKLTVKKRRDPASATDARECSPRQNSIP